MTPTTSDRSSARRPRSWEWRAGVGIAVLAVLTGLWLAWSRIAANRLQREVDRIRANHEPLFASDFKQPSVPDEENAAIPLGKALAAYSASPRPPSFLGRNPPYPPEWHQIAQRAISANRQALELAHEAALRPGIDWHSATPSFFEPRNLAVLLAEAAIDAHFAGDDELAIRRIMDLDHTAKEIEPDHLLALGMGRWMMRALEIILPDLAVQGDVAATQSAGGNARPVAQSELLRLRDELLDQKPELDTMRMFALHVRLRVYQLMQALRGQATVLRPMIDLETARVLDRQGVIVLAAHQPGYLDAEALLNREGLTGDGGPMYRPQSFRYSRAISQSNAWPQEGLEFNWLEITERRVVAIVIAVRLYRASFGKWPADLESLVPEFLNRIPTNPLVPGDKPIEYHILRGALPDGGDRPMLRFAVRDAGGPSHPIQRPCFGVSTDAEGKYEIQWRDLSRWYPPPQPSKSKQR